MHTLGFLGMPGHTEVILIIFIILLLFGAKKLPELSRSLGKSLGEFKKGQKEGGEPDEEDVIERKEITPSDVPTDVSAEASAKAEVSATPEEPETKE